MGLKLKLANVARWIARAISIPLVVLSLPASVLWLTSFYPGWLVLLLLAAPAGLLVAWWGERLGALIALAGAPVLTLYAWLSGEAGDAFEAMSWGSPLLVQAIWLFGFISSDEYVLGSISWALLLLPIFLFAASWWLRRVGKTATD